MFESSHTDLKQMPLIPITSAYTLTAGGILRPKTSMLPLKANPMLGGGVVGQQPNEATNHKKVPDVKKRSRDDEDEDQSEQPSSEDRSAIPTVSVKKTTLALDILSSAEREWRDEVLERLEAHYARRRGASGPEDEMTKEWVKKFFHPEFPFLVAAEYEHVPGLSNLGAGDLIFSSDRIRGPGLASSFPGRFHPGMKRDPAKVLIVELKSVNPSGRTGKYTGTKRLEKCMSQMHQSMAHWKRHFPQDEVHGLAFSSKHHSQYRPMMTEVGPNVGSFLEPASVAAIDPIEVYPVTGLAPCGRVVSFV